MELNPHTTVLVALAVKAGVLGNIFDRRDLKEGRKRIREIGDGNLTTDVAQEVIDSVNAAVIVNRYDDSNDCKYLLEKERQNGFMGIHGHCGNCPSDLRHH